MKKKKFLAGLLSTAMVASTLAYAGAPVDVLATVDPGYWVKVDRFEKAEAGYEFEDLTAKDGYYLKQVEEGEIYYPTDGDTNPVALATAEAAMTAAQAEKDDILAIVADGNSEPIKGMISTGTLDYDDTDTFVIGTYDSNYKEAVVATSVDNQPEFANNKQYTALYSTLNDGAVYAQPEKGKQVGYAILEAGDNGSIKKIKDLYTSNDLIVAAPEDFFGTTAITDTGLYEVEWECVYKFDYQDGLNTATDDKFAADNGVLQAALDAGWVLAFDSNVDELDKVKLAAVGIDEFPEVANSKYYYAPYSVEKIEIPDGFICDTDGTFNDQNVTYIYGAKSGVWYALSPSGTKYTSENGFTYDADKNSIYYNKFAYNLTGKNKADIEETKSATISDDALYFYGVVTDANGNQNFALADVAGYNADSQTNWTVGDVPKYAFVVDSEDVVEDGGYYYVPADTSKIIKSLSVDDETVNLAGKTEQDDNTYYTTNSTVKIEGTLADGSSMEPIETLATTNLQHETANIKGSVPAGNNQVKTFTIGSIKGGDYYMVLSKISDKTFISSADDVQNISAEGGSGNNTAALALLFGNKNTIKIAVEADPKVSLTFTLGGVDGFSMENENIDADGNPYVNDPTGKYLNIEQGNPNFEGWNVKYTIKKGSEIYGDYNNAPITANKSIDLSTFPKGKYTLTMKAELVADDKVVRTVTLKDMFVAKVDIDNEDPVVAEVQRLNEEDGFVFYVGGVDTNAKFTLQKSTATWESDKSVAEMLEITDALVTKSTDNNGEVGFEYARYNIGDKIFKLTRVNGIVTAWEDTNTTVNESTTADILFNDLYAFSASGEYNENAEQNTLEYNTFLTEGIPNDAGIYKVRAVIGEDIQNGYARTATEPQIITINKLVVEDPVEFEYNLDASRVKNTTDAYIKDGAMYNKIWDYVAFGVYSDPDMEDIILSPAPKSGDGVNSADYILTSAAGDDKVVIQPAIGNDLVDGAIALKVKNAANVTNHVERFKGTLKLNNAEITIWVIVNITNKVDVDFGGVGDVLLIDEENENDDISLSDGEIGYNAWSNTVDKDTLAKNIAKAIADAFTAADRNYNDGTLTISMNDKTVTSPTSNEIKTLFPENSGEYTLSISYDCDKTGAEAIGEAEFGLIIEPNECNIAFGQDSPTPYEGEVPYVYGADNNVVDPPTAETITAGLKYNGNGTYADVKEFLTKAPTVTVVPTGKTQWSNDKKTFTKWYKATINDDYEVKDATNYTVNGTGAERVFAVKEGVYTVKTQAEPDHYTAKAGVGSADAATTAINNQSSIDAIRGDVVYVNVTPDAGYAFEYSKVVIAEDKEQDAADITANCDVKGTTNGFSFVMPNKSVKVTIPVVADANVKKVIAEYDEEQGELTYTGKVVEGSTLNVTVTPKAGYEISKVEAGYRTDTATIDATNVELKLTSGNVKTKCDYTMKLNAAPAKDLTIKVTFVKTKFYVTKDNTITSKGQIRVSFKDTETEVAANTPVYIGDELLIEATKKDGYRFTGWIVEGEGTVIDNMTDADATLTVGSSNIYLSANFIADDNEEAAKQVTDMINAMYNADGTINGEAATTGEAGNIAKAKAAYEAYVEEYVTNKKESNNVSPATQQKLKDLEQFDTDRSAAAEVDDEILSLYDEDGILIATEAEVAEVMVDYNALTNQAKGMVKNYKKLTDAAKNAKAAEAARTKAGQFVEAVTGKDGLVAKYGEELNDKNIEAVRTALDKASTYLLSDAEKEFLPDELREAVEGTTEAPGAEDYYEEIADEVAGYNLKVAFAKADEADKAANEAVDAAEKAVEALGEEPTEEELGNAQKKIDDANAAIAALEEAIKAIDEAVKDAPMTEEQSKVYDELTDDAELLATDNKGNQSKIDAYDLSKEEKAAALKVWKESFKPLLDKKDSITLDDRDAIDAAKKAYDDAVAKMELDDPENLDAFKSVATDGQGIDAVMNTLEEEYDNAELAEGLVDELTKDLNELVPVTSLTVAEAKQDLAIAEEMKNGAAGKHLTAAGMAQLDKVIADLTEALELYDATAEAQEKDRVAVAAVVEKINAIPDEAGVEDEAAVKEAQAAYDALTEAQQAMVPATAKEKLAKAAEQVAAAKEAEKAEEDNKVAKEIEALIDAIPDTEAEVLSEAGRKAVKAATEAISAAPDAYNKIPAEKQEKWANAVAAVLKAEAEEEAKDANEKIAAIPADPTTEAGRAAVKAARDAYDKLSDMAKLIAVPEENLKKLTDAEAAIAYADDAANKEYTITYNVPTSTGVTVYVGPDDKLTKAKAGTVVKFSAQGFNTSGKSGGAAIRLTVKVYEETALYKEITCNYDSVAALYSFIMPAENAVVVITVTSGGSGSGSSSGGSSSGSSSGGSSSSGSSSGSSTSTATTATTSAGPAAGSSINVTNADGSKAAGTVVKSSADGKAILATVGSGDTAKDVIVDNTGAAVKKSVVAIGDSTYLTDENGAVIKEGFHRITADEAKNAGDTGLKENDLVYTKADGSLEKNGVFRVDGHRYNAGENGKIVTNDFWTTDKGNTVYSNDNGMIVAKKLFTAVPDGKLYYSDKSGKILKNKTVTYKGKTYKTNGKGVAKEQ